MDKQEQKSDLSGQRPKHREYTANSPNGYVGHEPRITVSFRRLHCHGVSVSSRYQATISSYLLAIPSMILKFLSPRRDPKVTILDDFEGLIRPGEMLLVLGRPGSGCSTFLKTLACETSGFQISEDSEISYQGIPFHHARRVLKGKIIYLAELDVHFPELTLGQTLEFGASTRPQEEEGDTARDVAEQFNLAGSFDTKVGNAMIRGLSGGEKRRTSIAEVFLGRPRLQCWDNSTRGLDSLTALQFVKLLRNSTSSVQSTVAMSLYQASEDMYNNFDKVILLYEGRQIYFGPVQSAASYFVSLGFVKPNKITTADFLTSLTHLAERVVRPGYEDRVPRLPEEFSNAWKHSAEARAVRAEIVAEQSEAFNDGLTDKDRLQSQASTLQFPEEVAVCMRRAFQRMHNAIDVTIGSIVANVVLGLVVGSAFYNLDETTENLQQRAVLIFFALVVNSFATAYEITLMWLSRPIVEKHDRYAFYRPVAEGVASIVTELPVKVGISIALHLPIYFLSNLRLTPSAFFTHWVFMLINLITMSMLFRMIGSLSRTLEQSIPPVAVLSLLCVIYTGFVVPEDYMRPWLGWFWRINPAGYTYESLMINEFRDRLFPCVVTVPSGPEYEFVGMNDKVCTTIGSVSSTLQVEGSRYISLKYGYETNHLWRNFGILIAMMVAFFLIHLLSLEYVKSRPSRGEVLFFRRRAFQNKHVAADNEKGNHGFPIHATQDLASPLVADKFSQAVREGMIPTTHRGGIFHWQSINYEIKTRNGLRNILTDISGWVKPGTLTALMGVTGAGKTALLDTLADRITVGTVHGDVFINDKPRGTGFRRRMGYVQQEDIHLHTATVREALQFSALLRQPRTRSKEQKLSNVEEILDILELKDYSEAIVGVPGEGLNVEQRKRLTIAVEMAAKPDLLLFLDEPTSGLDSQTAWSICRLLRKLADNGHCILCTIHQPSSQIFSMFDRLLLLDKTGTMLYFGDIGTDGSTVANYFESRGAPKCEAHDNPAEWILEVTGNKGVGECSQIQAADGKWPREWQLSEEKKEVHRELMNLRSRSPTPMLPADGSHNEYAASMLKQFILVSQRIFVEQWRDPVYTYSKVSLCISLALINGLSFYNTSFDIQGLISLLFSNFLITQLFSCINQLVIPRFVNGRQLFEARERHSESYTWAVFIAANLFVETVWQTAISVPVFVSWYYPIGLYRNPGSPYGSSERGGLTFLLIWLFNLWANTLSQAFGVGIEQAETVVQAATLCFWLSLVFSGILVPPNLLPRFWIFLYRVSPLTYLIEGLAVTGLANRRITCSSTETISNIPIPSNTSQTCGQYLEAYVGSSGGYVVNPNGVSGCQYCPVANANVVLKSFGMDLHQPWRDVGFLAAYVAVNVLATFAIYWLARVPKRGKK
ncbi:ABC transporter-like protein [Xylaria castorea]|nr:ABC transporter-like protein [Xylaria castorea]